jgi:hypothetical protein
MKIIQETKTQFIKRITLYLKKIEKGEDPQVKEETLSIDKHGSRNQDQHSKQDNNNSSY